MFDTWEIANFAESDRLNMPSFFTLLYEINFTLQSGYLGNSLNGSWLSFTYTICRIFFGI